MSVIDSITLPELQDAMRELAECTGNGNNYFPKLADWIFDYVERRRVWAALGGAA